MRPEENTINPTHRRRCVAPAGTLTATSPVSGLRADFCPDTAPTADATQTDLSAVVRAPAASPSSPSREVAAGGDSDAFDAFYTKPSPLGAVRLAIADHRAGKIFSSEFLTELHKAEDMLADPVRAALLEPLTLAPGEAIALLGKGTYLEAVAAGWLKPCAVRPNPSRPTVRYATADVRAVEMRILAGELPPASRIRTPQPA